MLGDLEQMLHDILPMPPLHRADSLQDLVLLPRNLVRRPMFAQLYIVLIPLPWISNNAIHLWSLSRSIIASASPFPHSFLIHLASSRESGARGRKCPVSEAGGLTLNTHDFAFDRVSIFFGRKCLSFLLSRHPSSFVSDIAVGSSV